MDIKKILASMSLEEKAGLCLDGALWRTRGYPEHGIPVLSMSDGTNGLRYIKGQRDIDPAKYVFRESISASLDTEEGQSATTPATCFPTGSALAASWDRELAEEIAEAVANEAKSQGIGVLFGPGMNTRRHPLDGRGFEYYSEDPVQAGEMAGHYVKGLQRNDVGGTLKHFVCNNTNYMRTISDSVVEERALREIYLAAFERAIRIGKPAGVMSSYNLLNGTQASENKWLLTDVLRGDLGFDGMVISDSSAIKDPVKAFKAGLDWQMPFSNNAINALVDAVRNGDMTEEELDAHCIRILKTVDRYSRDGKEKETVDFDAHHELARKAAAKCAILLKNEGNILPFDNGRFARIAVVGSIAKHPIFQGTGCSCVPAKCVDDPLQEIRNVCPDGVEIIYAAGYDENDVMTPESLREALDVSEKADAVVIFAASRLPLEDDNFNRRDMRLVASHDALIEAVAKVQHNAVVVLNTGESVEMPWINDVKGVLNMLYSGEGSGRAAADLLFGRAVPGGKLPVTMPVRLEDTPGYLNFPGENHQMIYEEGIFVGYRYYEKRKVKPLFPFGFGLSYTSFEYSDLKLSSKTANASDPGTVSVTVRNTGSRAGEEIVQLYIADDHARLKRPVKELKHFAKVSLQPGESRTISFDLIERDFAYYDPFFPGWKTDSGTFGILVGASSEDIRLRGTIEIHSDQVYQPPVRPDMHFGELFANPATRNAFYNYMIEIGELLPEDKNEENDRNFLTNFWGFREYLDYMLPYKMTPEMYDELTERIRKAAAGNGKNC